MGYMPPSRRVRTLFDITIFAIDSANKLLYDAEALRGKVGQIFENLAFSVKKRARRGSRFAPRSFRLSQVATPLPTGQ
jgi:hypothetical protein